MLWFTDTLYTSHPRPHRDRAAHTSLILRTRLNRRLTILVLIALVSLILVLTRVLGQIARDSYGDTLGAAGVDSLRDSRMGIRGAGAGAGGSATSISGASDYGGGRRYGGGGGNAKAGRREWERWKARREAEGQRTKEARKAEDMRLWLMSRLKDDGDSDEWQEDNSTSERETINEELDDNNRGAAIGKSSVEAPDPPDIDIARDDVDSESSHPIAIMPEESKITAQSNNETPIHTPTASPSNVPQTPSNPDPPISNISITSTSIPSTNPINVTNPPTLGRHTYHPSGLLQVNPTGPHPIYELIQRSEAEWVKKHQGASKTLQEAVREYKRRYGRLPPTGFDIWWEYVQKHHIMLPDEYDQINHDLAPFWAVDPRDLQATQGRHESDADSYTIGKSTWSAPLSVLNFAFHGEKGRMDDYPELVQSSKHDVWGDIWGPAHSGYLRKESDFPESFLRATSQGNSYGLFIGGAFNVFDILDKVQDYIPPFRAVFSPHDNPSLLRDWDIHQQALDATKNGKTLDIKALTNAAPPPGSLGWRIACPPASPARQDPNPANWDSKDVIAMLPLPDPIVHAGNKSFIHSHSASMDPCAHPAHFILHGQFISHRQGPVPVRDGGGLIPTFSWSPTSLHTDISVAVGEGSYSSSPFVHDGGGDEEFGVDLGDEGDFEDLGMEVDIEGLLDLPEDELEHALDLDTDPRLLWRGSNTGIYHAPKGGWERAQRARLVFWAGGGEGAVSGGINTGGAAVNAVLDQELEEELGEHLDLKTAAAFGAGLRGKLHLLVPPPNDYPESTTSPMTNATESWLSSSNITRRPIGPLTEVKKAHYAPSMLDIAFVAGNSDDGGPNNCEKGTCETLRTIFEWRKRMEMKEASQYRFVMDVDGHAWSSRFRKLLVGTSESLAHSASHSETSTRTHSNDPVVENSVTPRRKRWDEHLQRRKLDEPSASLVFKATIYKEWWYDRAQPWVHYVPIQIGLEDLWDVLVFFRGKLGEDIDDLVMELRRHKLEEEENVAENGARSKKREALERRFRDLLERHLLGRKIARRGRKWAQRYWRKEDMVAYMFRLFLEYARVMSPERDEMLFDPDNPEAGFRAPFPPGPRKWEKVEAPEPSEIVVQDAEKQDDDVGSMDWFDEDMEYDWNDDE